MMSKVYAQDSKEWYPVAEIWEKGRETDPRTGKPYVYLHCLEIDEETEVRWLKTFADFAAVQEEIFALVDIERENRARQ